jgi:hypothetical protein
MGTTQPETSYAAPTSGFEVQSACCRYDFAAQVGAAMPGRVILAVIAFLCSAASACAEAQTGDDSITVCIAGTARQYVSACEPADITARAVAQKCAPKPILMTDAPRTFVDRGDSVLHDHSYLAALVQVFEIRSREPGACRIRP